MSPAPTARHWAAFAGCVVLWGSAYAVVHEALATGASPSVIVAVRMWIGTALLHAVLALQPKRGGLAQPYAPGIWPRLVLMGVIGAALPLFLLGLAQRYIDSGLVGILAALTPLMVLIAAPLVFTSERLTTSRVIGFGLGFAGVVVLMGPEALAGLGGPGLWGQLAAAAAAACYAVNALVARAGPPINPIAASAGSTLFGALLSTPFALVSLGTGAASLNGAGLMWIAVLAVGPTALASVLQFALLRQVGPLFVTQTNYLIPPFAVGVGMLALGEQPSPGALLAFGLIALGLFWAQEAYRPLLRRLTRPHR